MRGPPIGIGERGAHTCQVRREVTWLKPRTITMELSLRANHPKAQPSFPMRGGQPSQKN